jgi:hypothetical protein
MRHVRSRSATLFSGMLFASARFFRTDLCQRLWLHARTMAFRDVADSKCEIETVQAFCCLVFWKRPSDKSAWLDLGVAIRMALQMRLHEITAPPIKVFDGTELAHRTLAVSGLGVEWVKRSDVL